MTPVQNVSEKTPALAVLFEEAASFHRQGRLNEAAQRCRTILGTNADHAETLHLLGVICAQQGRLDEGRRWLRKSLAQNPKSAGALNNLGHTLNLMKRHAEAILPLESAIGLNPAYAVAHNNLGVALQALGRHQDAAACFEKALFFKPDYAEAHRNLGVLYMEIGRMNDARRCLEAAIKIDPQNAEFHFNLVKCKPLSAGDPHLAELESLAKKLGSGAGEESVQIHFALGKAYADLGEHERSFKHLFDGNSLKRKQIAYSERDVLGRFDRIRAAFTTDLVNAKQGSGSASNDVIFILGMPRSGSTLVEQVLASHPKVFAAGERPDFGAALSLSTDGNSSFVYPESVPGLTGESLDRLGAAYLARLRAMAAGTGSERITDKMPANFQYIGLIHLALPNARIIHTSRDPIDTCLSCFSQYFIEQPFTFDLGELGRYYRAYASLMEHWRKVLPEGTMLDVRYEALVDDFEHEACRIIDYCGLEWDDSCLSFYRTERRVQTASVTQVRQPIYRSSVGRWRPATETLRPLLDELTADLTIST